MASNYPTSLDNFTNPTSNDSLNSPSHSLQHANINDAVEAIEAKLGIGASTAGSATSGQVLTAGTGGTTTWSTLPAAGLTLVKTQTIGSAVSSVIVTDAFSSTYDNYRIILAGGTSSSSPNLNFQLRTGSTTSTASYYWSNVFSNYASASGGNQNGNNVSEWRTGYSSLVSSLNIELFGPFLSQLTMFRSHVLASDAVVTVGGYHNVSTSYDQFVISASTGTLTGGTIRVYGYRNS